MCGIAGYLNVSNQSPIDPTLLESMAAVLAHRGPNGQGIWISADGQVGFAHRRLSIVDLSDAGAQPMVDPQSQIALIFNGEIYNHLELRAELETLGYRFTSRSDTQTVLYAYKAWGIACLDRFEGMFSIAIYDVRSCELYLVRDRFGIKPLYFSLHGGYLQFGSEIKALWQLPWVRKKLNSLGIYHYLTFMAAPAPMTIYQGIYKLPAGFYLKVDAQGVLTFNEWYNPCARIFNLQTNEQEAIEQLRSFLRASIKRRLMADVPIGVFLSGGLDSSLITALMAEQTSNIKTFTIISRESNQNESSWARRVANHFSTDHHELIIDERDAAQFFDAMLYHLDEPIADPVCIPLYYVSQLLKNSGASVAMVGEGADELFCGYPFYTKYLAFNNRYWQPAQKLPGFMRHAGARLIRTAIRSPHYRDLMSQWANKQPLFWSGAVAFLEHSKKKVIREQPITFDPIIEQIYPGFRQEFDSYAVVEYHLQRLQQLQPEADQFHKMLYLELKHRLPELLLTRTDKMSMAASVEGRLPFLDHALVEFAFTLPMQMQIQGGNKYLLKKAAEGILPQDIIYRSKVGFAAPAAQWFKEGHIFNERFHHQLNRKASNNYFHAQLLNHLLLDHQTDDQAVKLWTLHTLMASMSEDHV